MKAYTLINAADHKGDGGSSGGGSRSSGLSELARGFPAACSGDSISATHCYAVSTHDLLRSKLLGVVPSKVILTQPAARTDSGDTQHFSVSRRIGMNGYARGRMRLANRRWRRVYNLNGGR